MAAVASRDGNHASTFTKTTFAGTSSLSRRRAPPIADFDFNGLTDPINDAGARSNKFDATGRAPVYAQVGAYANLSAAFATNT
jgi:hypothetical protein